MNIPELNISVTKAAIAGRVVDVVNYDEYVAHKESYLQRSDVSIPTPYKNKTILLPLKGRLEPSIEPISPGIYNAGCVDFYKYPEDGFMDKYVAKSVITMSNKDSIKDLIRAGDESKSMDETFITNAENVTILPIKNTDQPEMVALKMAINAKHIDIDTYANRFGDNYPNDKRQLKSSSATMKIIKRFCDNCDMEAVITIRDKNKNVPNPMGREISVSLTEDFNNSMRNNSRSNESDSDNSDEDCFD